MAAGALATASSRAGARPLFVTTCAMVATLMQSLDTTVANVALPYIEGSVSATSDQITWVLTSYIVAAAIVTPLTGWLEARLGRRNLFLAAVAGFVVASMLCGASTSLSQVVIFRLLQGAFGAPLVPLAQATLLDASPPERRGQAMAVFGIGVMIGPILGPALGGYLTDAYSWRYVFYINLPFGAFAFLGLLAFMPNDRTERPGSLDWFGFASLSLTVGALQIFLDRGHQQDWFHAVEVRWELTICLLGLWLFLVHTATVERPFVPMDLFADRNFVVGLGLIFVVGGVLLASLAQLTTYLETLMGYPVSTAGIVLAPRGIGTMAAMALAGLLSRNVDARLLIAGGFALMALALYSMSEFTPDVSKLTLINTGLIQGVGLGLVFVPLSTVSFATLPAHLRTQGTALFSLVRNIGSSIGISVTTALLTNSTTTAHAVLVEKITATSNPVKYYASLLDLERPSGRAALDTLLNEQAASLAYIDNFFVMMLVCVVVIPLVTLIRPTVTLVAVSGSGDRIS